MALSRSPYLDFASENQQRCAIGGHTPLAYNQPLIFIETPVFTRQIKDLVDDEEYRMLQLHLVAMTEQQLRTLRTLVKQEFD